MAGVLSPRLERYPCLTVSLHISIILDYMTVFWSHGSFVSSGCDCSGYKWPCFSAKHINTIYATLHCKWRAPDVDFFQMIRLQAFILVTRCHGWLFWWSAENRFDILNACSFNNQMMNPALTVQPVILLMEIIWNSATRLVKYTHVEFSQSPE